VQGAHTSAALGLLTAHVPGQGLAPGGLLVAQCMGCFSKPCTACWFAPLFFWRLSTLPAARLQLFPLAMAALSLRGAVVLLEGGCSDCLPAC